MAVLKFDEARETVFQKVQQYRELPPLQVVPLLESSGRVLAEPIIADRDLPPFPRATRDGFALRSTDVANPPVRLRIRGQIKAGDAFAGTIGVGECVEIMTGAPVPEGADAVIMVEHTTYHGPWVEVGRSLVAGENVVARGSEARQGDRLLIPGRRIGYAEIAMMAAVGKEQVAVYRQPRVAILPTGDEVVELGTQPGPYQIRNSNSYSLQTQVAAAHAVALPLGIAPDREDRLREMIAEGLQSNLLLLSGGVSAGKYDFVKQALAGFQAEFFFDGVLIQPGRPLVFGRAAGTFFFGLPGNPLSTMVTFELFVRPCLALLSGEETAPRPFLRARLGQELRRKPGLTAFLPAVLTGESDDPTVTPVEWRGSGDMASLTRANCYLAVPEEAAEIHVGEWVAVLPR
ncbi:MAG: molybdopterin molybdotransferase MoeA [Acidobacteria bacterium]|nr:molybdopterin molybdotransferase MoeA [Acidobacteriota bacterium]